MATEVDCEPMEQDCEDGGETLQVQLRNEVFSNNNENEEILDFEEADDLEISEFTSNEDKNLAVKPTLNPKEALKEKSVDNPDSRPTKFPLETITISVSGEGDAAKEDGELSETHSHSDESEDENRSDPYFSRSSSVRSSRRRNDIRRERSPVARRYPNPYLEFDDEKIQSRALRFGTANNDGTGSGTSGSGQRGTSAQISDDDLLNLYISCGLISDDGGKLTLEKVGSHHRLDSILIRGTNHMNTNEIFKYLYDHGHKPAAMEWVNDAMCVVIYNDNNDAAASLIKTSKQILMDPRLVERKRSIVQALDNDSNKDENNDEKTDSMNEDFDYDKVEAIPQSWITVPMPPGYVWRFGAPCDKAKGILLRYANKQDKKQERAERFSEYYRNYGNPNKAGNWDNSGEVVRRKKKVRHENQESNRKDSLRDQQIKMLNPNDKNGWGQLSAMWDDEEAFQKSARDRFSINRHNSKDSETAAAGVSPMKRPDNPKELSASKAVDAREILKTRQKRKRGTYSSDEDAGSNNNSDSGDIEKFDNDWKDSGSFRRKRNCKVVDDDDDDGDNIAWRERLSGPRMRMHADEEEERMKRRAFRRLGRKKGGESSLQTNSWEFSRDSSNNSSFKSKTASQARRPISERLGAKRSIQRNDSEEAKDENNDNSGKPGGFDLRHKLINMRRAGKGSSDQGEYDEEEDLHNLIFYPIDD